MQIQKIVVSVAALGIALAGYRAYGWGGVALVAGGLVMWLLLHVSRMLQVMQRAARQPVGSVASAVMLNAKLKPGVTLLHVVAMTRSLGALQSPKDSQPEHYHWTDAGASHVSCVFQDGKLLHWQLWRPAPDGA